MGGDEIRGLACVLWRAHSCCRIHTDAGLPKRDSVRVGGCAYLGACEVCVCVCVYVCVRVRPSIPNPAWIHSIDVLSERQERMRACV